MANDNGINRRRILFGGAAAAGTATLASIFTGGLWSGKSQAEDGVFKITKSEEEWRRLLTEKQYFVLRREGTERPYTSPLNDEKREGIFKCAACGLELYASKDKFDSKTGWPSFTRPVSDDAIGTKIDRKLIFARTEVHCRRCGGHLGHVFNDGPAPTGKRHCINGVALSFEPS